MAYINKEEAAEIRKEIKRNYPSSKGWKISVVIDNYSSLNISIMTAPFDFNAAENIEKANEVKEHLEELGKGKEWFDKSDIMTDYFFVKHYVFVRVGKWDKDFEVVAPKTKKTTKKVVKKAIETVDYSLIDDCTLANTYTPIEANEITVEEVPAKKVVVIENEIEDYTEITIEEVPAKKVVSTEEAKEIIEEIIKEDTNSISPVQITLYKGLQKIGIFKTIIAAKKISSYLGSGNYNLIGVGNFNYNDTFKISSLE